MTIAAWMRPPVRTRNLNRSLLETAGDLKVRFRMAYVDAITAATAIRTRSTLVTGDRDFVPLEKAGLLPVRWLR